MNMSLHSSQCIRMAHTQTASQPATQLQQLMTKKCSDQPYCLLGLVKNGLTSSPAGKITPKQQNSKAKTWSYNCSNAARKLRNDLTRNAGGSLTNKSMDEVMAAIKKI